MEADDKLYHGFGAPVSQEAYERAIQLRSLTAGVLSLAHLCLLMPAFRFSIQEHSYAVMV